MAPLDRWAGSFIAWDCLSSHMKTPYESNYELADILTGQVTCTGGSFDRGLVIAALLITGHLIFLSAPVVLAALLLKARPRLESHVRSFDTIILSMFAFVLASMGEIGQHCFDNWLYLDSRVSAFNFLFYLMTTASNGILASGIGLSKLEVLLSVVSCLATPASFVYEFLSGRPYMTTASEIPIWIGMFITTLVFIYRGWQLQLPGGKLEKSIYTTILLGAYVLGVVFAQNIIKSGYQAWHLLTATSFCTGFIFQGRWLLRAHSSPDMHAKNA